MPKLPRIERPIVLIGLMGAGKSTVGRRLARRLNLPFKDSDDEIRKAAQLSIEDIFEIYGESEFRACEKRVMKRLLDKGPLVLATGGGAFLNGAIRTRVQAQGTSVWLKADLDCLLDRTSRRGGRPLLNQGDPRKILEKLINERYPVYSKADITIKTDGKTHEDAVDMIIQALREHPKT